MIVLITGGIKSGKSRFALSEAEKLQSDKRTYFIATAAALDQEMEERITRHMSERKESWMTIEEPIDIDIKLSGIPVDSVVLIDCMTLWLCNIIHNTEPEIDVIKTRIRKIVSIIKEKNIHAFIVTNEVGSGIIPDNELSRVYADFLGIVNKEIAAVSDEVYLMVSGIAMKLK